MNNMLEINEQPAILCAFVRLQRLTTDNIFDIQVNTFNLKNNC